ncbi:exopolyphosphatase / guanosine-5'-triphosphate,3'-diphosphate pyrophosphatase [Alkalithermobacter thermoalcaliphilus JW-YL-7 = DSM 7308]|uniref:Exopolyphosphatase / guanosine-5'-triphosphate,3'-diphosphate pyrophosphatase n=1 Tax=Alkalithermobacter thermoalcaliphilus JW-YL-7 = DSM 7308 TaxID=1121328 RepID=A0A150FSL1_CLOPD|nr:Ppx/GppA phosphatase [[Clostridium] paradoxum JW-YL-7 = DSM 7308]SHK69566.1 exopolyphosphatase / guanosine-5'-triphosphate,3'-diphosphate pyrophosphatase [[Clostridium] paradoxum JW-YL-7 = DSM 7308]
MKLAAIDIGTNSMRLLIAEYVEEKFIERKKYINTTRIGQDVDKNGYISEDAINRNINAFKEFVDIAKQNECKKIWAIGTSALRDSKNKDDFIKKAFEMTNVNINVITGDEEANLGFLGTIQGIQEEKDILIVDIGGGSTEFIVGNKKDGIKFVKSEDIGALRMTEKILKNDLVNDSKIKQLNEYITDNLKGTIEKIKEFDINKVVGIGGTITTLSSVDMNLETYDMEKVHLSTLSLDKIENMLNKFKKMKVEDIKKIKGMYPKRADIITAGTCILMNILKMLNIKEVTISEYDNLEGLICLNAKKMS